MRHVRVTPDELDMAPYVREDMVDGMFWHYVDSQPTPYAQASEFAVLRGDDCLELRSDRDRCNRPTDHQMPFCELHFPKALVGIRAYVDGELKRQAESQRRSSVEAWLGGALDAGRLHDARAALVEANHSVYFFLVPNRAVKIGYSTNPSARLISLRNGGGGTKTPENLDTSQGYMHAIIPGGRAVETNFHRSLAKHRICGEWFRLTRDVQAAMDLAAADQQLGQAA